MSKISLEQCLDRLNALGAQILPATAEVHAWTLHPEHIAPFATPTEKRRPGKGGAVGGNTGAGSGIVDPHTVLKGELSPWGKLDDALWADIMPPIPLDWRLNDDQWWKWFEGVVHDIDALIWPMYRPSAWTDATVGRMLDADFGLLAELRPNMGLPIDSVFPTTVQHGDFFSDEDNRKIRFGTGYERYDPTLAPEVLSCFSTVLTAGIVDKVGSLDLLLKLVFQRPRAYQVALLQGRKEFSYQSAATANTPSLVSGHCLQAALAGCTVFAAFAPSFGLNARSTKILQHFTVDVGDRRVFAGVHFPSDNLSSWLTALKLVPFVFAEDEAPHIKAFLWEAINTRSMVFDAIKKHVDANLGGSPYEKAVAALRAIAGD